MKLVGKVQVLLAVVFSALILVNIAVLNVSIRPSFKQLEQKTATQDVERSLAAFEGQMNALASSATDWAHWTDTFEYINGTKDEFADDNLYDGSWDGVDVDLVYLIASDGRVVYRSFYEVVSGEHLEVPDQPMSAFDVGHPFLDPLSDGLIRTGAINTSAGTYLYSSETVIVSDETGEPNGVFVFGRRMNEARLGVMREQTNVAFDLVDYDATRWIEAGSQSLLTDRTDIALVKNSTGLEINGYGLLKNSRGEPVMIIGSSTPADITALGTRTIRTAILALGIVALLTMAAVAIGIRRIAVVPLQKLAASMKAIAHTGDMSERTNVATKDEVGALSAEFDGMLGELHTARERLLEQSFYAGRAEHAAGALHNIRNSLNPVGVAAWKLNEITNNDLLDKVTIAIGKISDPDTPAEKRAAFLEYLEKAAPALKSEREKIMGIGANIGTQVRNIEGILTESSSEFVANPVLGTVDLNMTFKNVEPLVKSGGKADITFNVDPDLPEVMAHSVLLTQVISNLVTNAREAIEATDRGTGTVFVSARELPGAEGGVEISITDDGDGFEQEKMEELFQRGFSTRREKSGGLGLHWSANSIAAMGGSIDAISKGKGQGATFRVRLNNVENQQASAV